MTAISTGDDQNWQEFAAQAVISKMTTSNQQSKQPALATISNYIN
jgi:hypothetical protein